MKPARWSAIQRLLDAKRASDLNNYRMKSTILTAMIKDNPDDFMVDSEADGIVGLTHVPTGFKAHLPKKDLILVGAELRHGPGIVDAAGAR